MPVTKDGSFVDFDDSLSESSDLSQSIRNDSIRRIGLGKHNSEANSSSSDLLGLEKHDGYAIKASRVLFFVFLLSAAGVLVWVVYSEATKDEVELFETQFDNVVNGLFVASEANVRNNLSVLNSLAIGMTAFMQYQRSEVGQESLPSGFITLPNVEDQFSAARASIGALTIAYTPIVSGEDLEMWNNYSETHQGWISESNGGVPSKPILPKIWHYGTEDRRLTTKYVGGAAIEHTHRNVAASEDDQRIPVEAEQSPFAPVWTRSPPPPPADPHLVNYDLHEKRVFQQASTLVRLTRNATLLDVSGEDFWFGNNEGSLQTIIAYPVFDNSGENRLIVGHLTAIIPWTQYFMHIHGVEEEPVSVVMENKCGHVFTFELKAEEVTVIDDEADVHDTDYNYLGQEQTFAKFIQPPRSLAGDEHCIYTISVYPTQAFEGSYLSSEPRFYALIVVCVFLSTTMLFFIFDCLVQKRQDRVISMAIKQNAIVSSLFPKNVQEKMLAEVEKTKRLSTTGKAGIKSYLKDAKISNKVDKSKPIADLFPATTIMFADIAGFTAWSSTREPSAVFTLLETVYHFFDETAKRRKVFKVEVVGDCYVAVCGLPDPRKDHAVVMAKFAYECLRGMGNLTKDLEVELGPDTTELGLRVGLHSGPVVAGVLRGEKSRFQLFGDTMNTASRMESTGVPNRIQTSQETADLLIAAKKSHWLVAREDKVQAKGKGELTTFWIMMGGGSQSGSKSVSSMTDTMSVSSGNSGDLMSLDDFQLRDNDEATNNRIADWTVEVLAGLLKEIEARRRASKVKKESVKVDADAFNMRSLDFSIDDLQAAQQQRKNKAETWEKKLRRKHKKKGSTVIDEVEEIIMLPEFDAAAAKKEKNAAEIRLDQKVIDELRSYVRTIATMYNSNPFHNFAHANHVTMSVTKLLSRIVAPDMETLQEGANTKSLHDHTYGITGDPLTRFAVVLSALIHDVDHDGVSNMQLVKEKTEAAKLYKGKSVAEQNSVDLSWNLLMEPAYKNLRNQIYSTEPEFNRFRQLVVNTVMATDIMDRDLKTLRNDRWDKAFSIPPEEERKDPRAVNRKATIVIEHLIQASDVAHTMQHWQIYRKWNERLFQEMYKAYEEGRMPKDPSIDWYKGEIGFFDFYIIPLAKKLKECGVFGVSSDEYLSYAQQNRKEWEKRGEEIVIEMVTNVKRKNVGDLVYLLQQDNIDQDGQKFVKESYDSYSRPRPKASEAHQMPPREISTGEICSSEEFDYRDGDIDFDIPVKD